MFTKNPLAARFLGSRGELLMLGFSILDDGKNDTLKNENT